MTHIDLHGVNWDAVDREQQRTDNIVRGWAAPRVLPPMWAEIQRDRSGAKYMNDVLLLAAILSCNIEIDGRAWLHLSVSHRDRVPKWRELVEVKELFLGDRESYQVLPPKKRYVNIHPNVLHLFALLDESASALPDFTRGTGSL